MGQIELTLLMRVFHKARLPNHLAFNNAIKVFERFSSEDRRNTLVPLWAPNEHCVSDVQAILFDLRAGETSD